MKRMSRAFSLIEVVIAVGVVGFALLAIIGLLPVGIQSARGSIQETRANHLADQIFATLRSQPFAAVNLASLGDASSVDLSTSTSSTVHLHGSYDGNFVPITDYFAVDVSFRNNPDGLTPGTANEVHVRITCRETGTLPLSYATIIAAH